MSHDFSKYKGLIFDMDGTLLDTMPSHLDAWGEAAEHFSFPFERAWINGLGGMPSVKIVDEINRKYNTTLEPKTVANFKAEVFIRMGVVPDRIACTVELLEKYQGEKKMAVGTGSLRDNALRLLEQAQLLEQLQAVVTASDVERHKPEPDTFLLAAEKIGVASQECVVFEDTELGKQAAHRAGMDCFMVVDNQLVFHPVSVASL